MSESRPPTTPEVIPLKRSLSLPLITLYGLGTTIGAGIYVLVGEVAAEAGMFAPVSFAVASVIASLTAMTFAELSSRHPKSAGEAIYVNEGLGLPGVAVVVGGLVVFTGLVSAAAMANGFVGYFNELIALPRRPSIILVVGVLGVTAAIGISQSVTIAALITVVEVGGLIFVVWVARDQFGEASHLSAMLPPLEAAPWGGIMAGSVLAFFAFIGFEDMVNVAEEVKGVRRTLPLAIMLTLGITTVLYALVTVVAVAALPLEALSGAEAPLALLYTQATGAAPTVISLIAIVAVLNGALIQVIMASRVLYGLSNEGWLPSVVGTVHPVTRTPLVATALASGVVLLLALALPLITLALTTSLTVLVVYGLVNLALWRIKRRDPEPEGVVTVPLWVPITGFVVNVAFIGFQVVHGLGD